MWVLETDLPAATLVELVHVISAATLGRPFQLVAVSPGAVTSPAATLILYAALSGKVLVVAPESDSGNMEPAATNRLACDDCCCASSLFLCHDAEVRQEVFKVRARGWRNFDLEDSFAPRSFFRSGQVWLRETDSVDEVSYSAEDMKMLAEVLQHGMPNAMVSQMESSPCGLQIFVKQGIESEVVGPVGNKEWEK